MPHKDPAAARAYFAEYRKRNRDLIAKNRAAHYQSHRSDILERHREYRLNNRDAIRASKKGCGVCKSGQVHDFKHGCWGYQHHGCRCEVCRETYRIRRTRHPDRERMQQRERYARDPDEANDRKRRWRKQMIESLTPTEERALREKEAARVRQYRTQNPERYRIQKDQWRTRNRRRLREQQRQRQELHGAELREWRERNRDRVREGSRDYYARHQEQLRQCARDRYSDLKRSLPASRNGAHWTAAEDAIVTRTDITLTEMCFMLERSYQAVSGRRNCIRRRSLA